MRCLSWLFGSMSVAFLVAGCLLLLQPGTAKAGLFGNCSDCVSACRINDGNPGGCANLYCTGANVGGKTISCSGPLGGNCDCSFDFSTNLCDTCS